jgi:hypothetical protein
VFHIAAPPSYFAPMALSRRDFLAQSASLGAALAALAAAPGAASELLGDVALAAGDPSADNLRTFVAICEAVCSFDGLAPPPARVDGRPHPTAADTGARFAAEYRAQSAGLRQTFDTLLALVEQAPHVPPPIGATSAGDFAAYGGRSFSELDVPLRLRFIRSWAEDFNTVPLGVGSVVDVGALPPAVAAPLIQQSDPLGVAAFHDVGTLHRGVAAALIQLGSFFFYEDPRSWGPLGYGGPWLQRAHEDEEMPFSHHDHSVNSVLYGDGVVA